MSLRSPSQLIRLFTRHGVIVCGALVALVVWASFLALGGSWLQEAEERVSDAVWRVGAERRDERRLIIVDIDEKSLAEVGPWPWPRATQARLLDRLASAGAGLQILDIVFAESRADDAVLAAALRAHQPVLAQVFALEPGADPKVGQLAGPLAWSACPAPFAQAGGYVANAPGLLNPPSSAKPATAQAPVPPWVAGHITPRVGQDGVVRQQPAVVCANDQSYPALALAALLHGTSEEGLVLQRGTAWWGPHWLIGGKTQTLPAVPLGPRGDMRIPWTRHPDSFISLSAADVLQGKVPAGLLDNAWVLLGSSAFGLNDTIATPFSGLSAGMQAHAQLITGMIEGRVPYTPRAAPLYQLCAALLGLAGLACVVWGVRAFPVYLLPLAALGWAGLLLGVHGMAQWRMGLWLGWAGPALYVLCAGLCMAVFEHARSRIDRDRLYTHLASYLPSPVAAALALQPPSSAIRASKRQVSVLFADIRNFSAYCEARPPEEAAAVLHAFFSTAAKVIEAHGGVIESFQGDAVIAVWNADDPPTPPRHAKIRPAAAPAGSHTPAAGDPMSHDSTFAPEPQPGHARQALAAALELLRETQGVLPNPAPAGLEPLALGIGVETGPAMAGSFGLARRRTHMVMGRTVTIASRLVGMTADLAHPILVGEGLAGQVGGDGLQSMGTFLLDGLRVPHHVYAPPVPPPAEPAVSGQV